MKKKNLGGRPKKHKGETQVIAFRVPKGNRILIDEIKAHVARKVKPFLI